jgi:DNA polymerase-1
MKQPKPVVIDFETFGIEGRPDYPPEPVGVSIKYPGKKSRYYGWGHPTKNNSTFAEAQEALKKAYEHKDGLLFQNAKFDVDVADVHMGLPVPEWHRIHDTLFLLFLDDPHQKELGLKPSSERLLGLPPEEQDAVGKWLVKNQPIEGVKISQAKSSDHYFGRYIAFAPGDIVGKYANGDVDRTEQLFNLLWPKTLERQMIEAYDRERELMPILLEMERNGVPVDLKRLRADVELYNGWRHKIDMWIIKTLKADPAINLDSGEQLVKAMVLCGKADPDLIPKTPTGKYQTNKQALLLGVTDKVLLAMLKYRTQLNTCMNTFMVPWLKVAERSGGKIFTTWNQTKSTESGGAVGTRTGRLSSTPNFQNVPKIFKPIFDHEQSKSKLPKCPLKDLPGLPLVRGYITSSKGHVLCGRDFSSQELRVLAHFEDGEMKDRYNEEPGTDLHQYAADLITSTTGVVVSRSDAKTIAFSILYGSGLGKLAEGVGCSVEEAKKLRDAYLGTFGGIKNMQKDMKSRASEKLPIRTWGGREYYCEEPKFVDGRMRTFDYKLLNVLIQGSSADQTKAAMIRFYNSKTPGKLLLTVHDEIIVEAPTKQAKAVMAALKTAMNEAELDVPMISDGEMGTVWTEMKPCD